MPPSMPALSATYTFGFWSFDHVCRNTAQDVWTLLNKLPSIKTLRIRTVSEGEDNYGAKKLFDYGLLELGPSETGEIRKYQTALDYSGYDATNFASIIAHYDENGLPHK